MIVTIFDLKDKYKRYSDINGKIKRDVKNNLLFPVVRGIYETNKHTSGYLLASFIYNPSYLSFEYALSFHNLIPEKVVSYTSATFNKNKSKAYKNSFGLFLYRDVPKDAYPYFINAYEVDTYAYFIASPEKALCDMLYILQPANSVRGLKSLLFENLRIDINEFRMLNFEHIIFLSGKYISKNIQFLRKLIESEYEHDNNWADD